MSTAKHKNRSVNLETRNKAQTEQNYFHLITFRLFARVSSPQFTKKLKM